MDATIVSTATYCSTCVIPEDISTVGEKDRHLEEPEARISNDIATSPATLRKKSVSN